ncbi:gamma-glutamyl kinase [Aeromonas hydrophila]|nr:gamma-glutamyl kinase [Aeromonas hydrophila]
MAPTLPNKQMLAAVGQTQLIRVWQDLFNLYGLHIGQMLLTRADLEDRERYLNARDTLRTLLDHRIIPVINENDAVATAEIKVGDNDNLSARAAILSDADLLILLTDQKGLFTADPRTNPDAQLIEEVQTIDDTLRKLAGDSVSGLGTGGMATKLQAADVARRAGVNVVIATGQMPEVVGRLAKGERIGTLFPALASPLEGRKSWILAGPPPHGEVQVDQGAVAAMQEKGSSLLPKGIVAVKGDFVRGDVVRILDPKGPSWRAASAVTIIWSWTSCAASIRTTSNRCWVTAMAPWPSTATTWCCCESPAAATQGQRHIKIRGDAAIGRPRKNQREER